MSLDNPPDGPTDNQNWEKSYPHLSTRRQELPTENFFSKAIYVSSDGNATFDEFVEALSGLIGDEFQKAEQSHGAYPIFVVDLSGLGNTNFPKLVGYGRELAQHKMNLTGLGGKIKEEVVSIIPIIGESQNFGGMRMVANVAQGVIATLNPGNYFRTPQEKESTGLQVIVKGTEDLSVAVGTRISEMSQGMNKMYTKRGSQ